MKKYSAKTLDEAIKIACTDLDINTEDLIYEVEEEKKGLFKKAVISVMKLLTLLNMLKIILKMLLMELV